MSASSEFGQLRVLEMAAQITSSYASHHPVTAAHTVKYFDEIHKALTSYLTPEWVPPSPKRSWVGLLIGVAGGALAAIVGGLLIITVGQAKGGISTDLPKPSVSAETAAPTTRRIPTGEINKIDAPKEREDLFRAEKTGTQETYDDWNITCTGLRPSDCSLSQSSSAGSYAAARIVLRSGQEAGTLDAAITLPFEVPPTSRITLQTGAGGLKGPLPFQACRPEGCILSFTFSEREISELRRASLLQANATGDNDRTLSFQFSLKGFSSAFDHLRASPQ